MSSTEAKSLRDILNEFLSPLLEWLFAALHPVKKCQSLLLIASEEERAGKSIRLLAASAFVALVVDLPLYYPFGISLKSIEFHLSTFLCLTFVLIACGFSFQAGLRLYGIRSKFSDIVAIYTAYVMCYQPILNLLSYFTTFRFMSLLSAAKVRGLSLDQTVNFLLEHSSRVVKSDDLMTGGSGLCSWLLLTALCVSSAFMAAEVAERYSVTKIKSFSAVSFSVMVLLPFIGVLQSLVLAYIEYTFMVPSGSPPSPS